MKRIIFLLVAAAALACVIVSRTRAFGFAQEEAASIETSPTYGVTIPPGYRDWKLISVAHEKDSKKYAESGGWGFADFIDGKRADKAKHKTCFGCHEPAKDRDFVLPVTHL